MKVGFDFYPGGKRKAVTLSYDDGRIYDRKLIEIMNKYGIKGSFHLNSSKIGKEGYVTKEELTTLYKGHEVSLHGVEHLFLASIPDQMLIEEIRGDRKFFEKEVGYVVNGMSYAMGSYNKEVIKRLEKLDILYARTTKSHGNFSLPENFLEWNPTMHHIGLPDGTTIKEKAEQFTKLEFWRYKMPLFYLWGHSYEFNDNNNWDIIEEFCKIISRDTDIWFATNMEVYDYIQAMKSLKFSADCKIVKNPSAISVWIAVDDKPVEIKSGEVRTLS